MIQAVAMITDAAALVANQVAAKKSKGQETILSFFYEIQLHIQCDIKSSSLQEQGILSSHTMTLPYESNLIR
jgi:hypothetical protein